MNRRGFLKMLGMAPVGTLAFDQLSFLVKQPMSIITPGFHPYTTTFEVHGLHVGDFAGLYRRSDDKLIWQNIPHPDVGKVPQHSWLSSKECSGSEDAIMNHSFPVTVWNAEDAEVIVRTRTRTPMPFENHQVLPEGTVIKPDTVWRDIESGHAEFAQLNEGWEKQGMIYRPHGDPFKFGDL